jgi:hypothetical protein
MAWTDEVWLRSAFEALRTTFDVDRHLKKEMVQFLLDEGFWDKDRLEWDSAIARFNGCLNPNKSDFFKVGEVWALMRRFGRHELFLAMAEDLGYDVRIRPTEERRQQLLERIAESMERNEQTVASARADLARLDVQVPSSNVHSIPADSRRLLFSRHGDRSGVP